MTEQRRTDQNVEGMQNPSEEISTPTHTSPKGLNHIIPHYHRRIVLQSIIGADVTPTAPTSEQLKLAEMLKYRPMSEYYSAMEVIKALDSVNQAKCPGVQLDDVFVFWSIYGAGVIEGIRQERARRKGNRT